MVVVVWGGGDCRELVILFLRVTFTKGLANKLLLVGKLPFVVKINLSVSYHSLVKIVLAQKFTHQKR